MLLGLVFYLLSTKIFDARSKSKIFFIIYSYFTRRLVQIFELLRLSLAVLDVEKKFLFDCSGDLNTELVWYLNGRKQIGCQMVFF